MAPSFTFFDNRIVLSPEGDTIYEIDNNSITKGFIINWGQIPHKQGIEELYFRQAEPNNKVSLLGPVIETHRKAYFRVIKNKEYYIFEYDKITGISKSMITDTNNFGFINDLDGGVNYYPVWTNRTGDIWIEYDDAYTFKKNHSENYLSASVSLYPNTKEDLKVFLNNLKQDDNPVLKIVYLKKPPE